jgi:hypothetical protein
MTMAKALPCGFVLKEADTSDADELWRVLEKAYATDAVWWVTFKDCNEEDIHPWVMSVFSPRWLFPDITIYKIVEESSGYVPKQISPLYKSRTLFNDLVGG